MRPDVAFLDIGMPRLSGHDVCRRIRAEPWGKTVVLVALTGWGDAEDRSKSSEAGFDHHLVKPTNTREPRGDPHPRAGRGSAGVTGAKRLITLVMSTTLTRPAAPEWAGSPTRGARPARAPRRAGR